MGLKRKVGQKDLPVSQATEPEIGETKDMEVDDKESIQLSKEKVEPIDLKTEEQNTENETADKVKGDTKLSVKPKVEKPNEKPQEVKEETPKLKKVVKPKDKEMTNEDLKKKDESEKLPFGAKLRKTETVKRKIDETKMETVQLKNHKFEVKPQETDVEKTSNIILGKPLASLDEDKKTDKKRKIKKQKKKVAEVEESAQEDVTDSGPTEDKSGVDDIKQDEEEEILSPAEPENFPDIESEAPEEVVEQSNPMEVEVEDHISTQVKPEETADPIEIKSEEVKDTRENEAAVKMNTVDAEKNIKPKVEKPSEKPNEVKEEKPKLKKVVKPKNKEVKNEALKKEEVSENLPPFGAKLRKTETVKRKIDETKMETVQLKSHKFEVNPQDTDVEQTSGIILGKPLDNLDEEALQKLNESKTD